MVFTSETYYEKNIFNNFMYAWCKTMSAMFSKNVVGYTFD